MADYSKVRPVPPSIFRRMAADLRRLALRAMEDRQPLPFLSEEERIARLRAAGFGPDGFPLNASELEREANQIITDNPGVDPRYAKETSMEVSPGLQKAAAALATILGAAASIAPKLPFLPPWVPVTLWALAGVCALLAGLPLTPFGGDNPAVPLALVPLFASLAAGFAAFGSTLTSGTLLAGIVGFLSLLCAALTGKATPLLGHSANDNRERAKRLKHAA